MGAEKQLKISVAPDETSFRKAKLLVDDLTRSIEKLAKASNQMGGSGFLGVSANRTLPGLGGPSAQHQRPGQSTNVVANILGGDAGQLRTLVSGTQQAFSQVGSGIKTFIDRATADVARLTRAVQDLQRAAGGSGGMGGGTLPGMGPPMGMPGGGGGTMPGFAPHAPPGGGGPPTPGGGGGFGGMFRQWVQGRAQAGAQFIGLPPQASAAIGRFAGANAVGAGLGIGSVMAYNFGATSFENQRAAQLDYALNEPVRRLERGAAVAGIGRNSYMAGRGGDISYIKAQRDALGNREIRQAMDATVLQREQIELALGTGPSIKGLTRQGMDYLRSKAGSAWGGVGQMLSGQELGSLPGGVAGELGGVEGMSELKLRLQKAVMDSSPEMAQRFQTAVNANKMMQDPEFAAEANGAYAGAGSNLARRRQGFIGVPKGQDPIAYMRARQARLTKMGYEEGDEEARRAITTGAGMGYLRGGFGGTELMSLQYGGAQNVTSTMALAGQLGGSVGAGTRFIRNAFEGHGGFGGVGAGGLDVTVGSQLLPQLLQRAAGTGQFGAGNAAATYATSMASLVGGGPGAPFDTAQQQRMMAGLPGGESAFGRLTTGAAAPLYQATSLMGGIKAMGGFSLASEKLSQASPALLKAINEGADVPNWMSGLGIGTKEVKSFLNQQARAPFLETVDEMVPAGKTKDLLNQIRGAESKGGSFKDVFRGKSSKEQLKMAELLGPLVTGASSTEEGTMALMSQLGMSEGYTAMKGRGVGAAGPRGLEKAALDDKADVSLSAAKMIQKSVEELTSLFDTRGERAGGKSSVAAARGGIAHTMEEAVGQVSAQLNLLTANIASVNERFAKLQQRAR
jgi:hypothetical protein